MRLCVRWDQTRCRLIQGGVGGEGARGGSLISLWVRPGYAPARGMELVVTRRQRRCPPSPICVTEHVTWEESERFPGHTWWIHTCPLIRPGDARQADEGHAQRREAEGARAGLFCSALARQLPPAVLITWGRRIPPLTHFLPLPTCADEFNPFVPKLEKSVSGSSSSRDRLLLTVTMLLLAAVFIS